MCSIAGMIDLAGSQIPGLAHKLKVMNELQAHRGPDGNGIWMREAQNVGLAHCRLSIIDIASGQQPMTDHHGNWVCFNGEIYNYIELKQQLGGTYETTSDTEVILRAYEVWGEECVEHFSGMFTFALWDEKRQTLFCARDHFGIKPFYYAVVDGVFYFASEMKTLLPFLPSVETDPKAFQDYLVFQFWSRLTACGSRLTGILPAAAIGRCITGRICTTRSSISTMHWRSSSSAL